MHIIINIVVECGLLKERKPKGKLIVIEGLDKSGKTTQSRMLFNFYDKIYPGNVSLLSFPDYSTRIGREIKSFLEGRVRYNNEVKHMLLSANRWEKKPEIEGLREKDNIVIINRYYHSNLAYGLANGMNFDWLVNLDYGLPKEDIVIVTWILSLLFDKRGFDNGFVLDEFEKSRDFLEKAREHYLDLAKRFNWIVINSDSDVNSLLESITNIIGIDG